MSRIKRQTVQIEKGNVNTVRRAIVGTGYNIGTFYAHAAAEKVERGMRTKMTEEELMERLLLLTPFSDHSSLTARSIIELFKTVTL